ncbi:MAG: TonB-dependent receptor [Candidatus Kapaibacterium sp.]
MILLLRNLHRKYSSLVAAHASAMVLAAVCMLLPAQVRAQSGTTGSSSSSGSGGSAGPTGSISGEVVNAKTQAPIPGASIQVVGTKLGAITRGDGKFVVRSIPVGTVSIRVTSVGYEPKVVSDIPINTAKPYVVVVEMVDKIQTTNAVEVKADYFSASGEGVTNNRSLSAEEIRRAPGVQEDVIRSVALLPGVGVTQAGRNDLVVRGGAPFENLFVVDNIEVPNINHFGSQGNSGGPLTLVNIGFVRAVQFSAGGFGARYGNRVSSYTNISLRDGNDERFAGDANFSATGFGLILEGPIGDNATFLFNIRRSFLDILFKALGQSFIPDYWDMTFKTTVKLDSKNSLSFLALGALDKVSVNNDSIDGRYRNSLVAFTDQDQYFSGLTWKHLFNNGFFTLTLGRTFSDFRSRQQDSTLNVIFRNESAEGINSLNFHGTIQLSRSTELNFGSVSNYASRLAYNVTVPGFLRRNAAGVPQALSTDTTFTAFNTGAYTTVRHEFDDVYSATVGVRADYYAFLQDGFAFSPRLTLSRSLGQSTRLELNAGRYYQAPSFIWMIGDASNAAVLKPIRADQIVLGVEHRLTDDIRLQVEGFYKWYGQYPARVFRPQAVLSPSGFEDVTSDIPFGLEPLVSTGTGVARGFEVFVQKKLGESPLFGLISLTVQQSNFTGLDGVSRPGSFDSRFIFNIAAGYRIGNAWEISSKFRLAQGLLTTPFVTSGPTAGSLDFTQYNAGDRLPTFHAMDVRIDRRWSFESVQLITYIDVQNVYGRKNISQQRWDPRTQAPAVPVGVAVIPSIGLNLLF